MIVLHRVMNWRGLILICSLLLIAILTVFLVMQSQLNAQRDTRNQLQVELTNLQARNRELNAELSSVGTNEYISASARNNYSYVQKGEIRFEITNPEALYAYTEQELQNLMNELAQ